MVLQVVNTPITVSSVPDSISKENKKISSKQEYRINERIRSDKVRLVDENGENVGIVAIETALRRANDAGLDLVEIAPNADPPVVKIINFSTFSG